jgi:hypothetical protein
MAKKRHHYSRPKADSPGMTAPERPAFHGNRPISQMDSNEFYAGAASHDRHRFEDDHMIHEDDRAISNLPQDVKMTPYPMERDWSPEGYYDDGLSGIQRQVSMDRGQKMRQIRVRKA